MCLKKKTYSREFSICSAFPPRLRWWASETSHISFLWWKTTPEFRKVPLASALPAFQPAQQPDLAVASPHFRLRHCVVSHSGGTAFFLTRHAAFSSWERQIKPSAPTISPVTQSPPRPWLRSLHGFAIFQRPARPSSVFIRASPHHLFPAGDSVIHSPIAVLPQEAGSLLGVGFNREVRMFIPDRVLSTTSPSCFATTEAVKVAIFQRTG